MADDERTLDAERAERIGEDRRLRGGGPVAAARPFAVAEPGAVEGNGAVTPAGLLNDATDQQVVHHGAVAMQKDYGLTLALLDIVKPRTARRHEAPSSRIFPLRLPRLPLHKRRRRGHGNPCHDEKAATPRAPHRFQ